MARLLKGKCITMNRIHGRRFYLCNFRIRSLSKWILQSGWENSVYLKAGPIVSQTISSLWMLEILLTHFLSFFVNLWLGRYDYDI